MPPLSVSGCSSLLFTPCLLCAHTYGMRLWCHLPQPYSPGNKTFGKDVTKRYLIVSKYLMGIFFLCFAGHPLAPPNEQDLQFFFCHLFTQSSQLEAREPFLGRFNKWCFFPLCSHTVLGAPFSSFEITFVLVLLCLNQRSSIIWGMK